MSAPARAARIAHAAATAAEPETAISRLHSAGPIITPNPSIVPDNEFAAVSSCGVSASIGTIALCTGRVSVIVQLTTIAAAYTTSGGSLHSAAASTAVAAACAA